MSENLFDSMVDESEDSESLEQTDDVIDGEGNTDVPSNNPNEWFLTEEIKGEGDRPEYFQHQKYKSIAEQAKAYPEARKQISKLTNQLGAFTGAPESYDLDLGEEYEGVFPEEDILINGFIEKAQQIAKESNMNQEGFKKFAGAFGDYISDINKQVREYNKQQIEELGSNARQQMEEVIDWARQSANLTDEDDIEELKEMMSSSRAVKLLRKLRETSSMSVVPNRTTEQIYFDKDKLKQMLGDERYGNDSAYTKMVDEKYKSNLHLFK